MKRNQLSASSIPTFKKNSCACGSIGALNRKRELEVREVKSVQPKGRKINVNRSVKSRFLKNQTTI